MSFQNWTQIADLQAAAESWSPQQVLTWAFDTFGSSVAISSAFGVEGMALIDMASRVRNTSVSSPLYRIPLPRNL